MNSVRVLVLDDDPDDAFLIVDHFEDISGQSYEVDSTDDIDEAIDRLARDEFDILLCDYRMGAVSGVEVLERMRSRGIDTPTILMTGVSNDEVDRQAMEAGAADFMPKDELEPRIIDRAVRYALAANERQRLLRTVLDTASAAVLLVDEEGNVELSNIMAQTLAAKLSDDDEADGLPKLVEAAFDVDDREVRLAGRVLDRTCSDLDERRQLLVLHDVTDRANALAERKKAESRLAHAAMHDALTGLPNRDAFNAELLTRMEDAAIRGMQVALLSFDLNRFKDVNDVHGHQIGDELLRGVATRLREGLPDGWFVARLGGDEFTAITSVATDAVGPAKTYAREIIQRLGTPFDLGLRTIFTGSSIGIAVFPTHASDGETLIANADLAMYRAKKTPTQAICVFDETMDAAVRLNRLLADELRAAIRDDALEIYLQPQHAADDHRLTGFEALARWRREDGQFVPPDVFVGIAEECGLILELGEYLLRKCVRIAAKAPLGAKVAINVSPVQINHSDLPAILRSAMIEAAVSPGMIEVEVTESALIDNSTRALHALRQVRAMGVSIALDDFGTGYSSLGMLQSFPFDKIKIDKSFVNDLERPQSTAIVRSVVFLGENLGMKVLVEGVETTEQARLLYEMGCDELQGYLLGRPVPAEQALGLAVGLPAGGVQTAVKAQATATH